MIIIGYFFIVGIVVLSYLKYYQKLNFKILHYIKKAKNIPDEIKKECKSTKFNGKVLI